MSQMFQDASAFNADISDWDLRALSDAWSMFKKAKAFTVDITGWSTPALVPSKTYDLFTDADAWLDLYSTPGGSSMGPFDRWSRHKFTSKDELQEMLDVCLDQKPPSGIGCKLICGDRLFCGEIGDWDVSQITDLDGLFKNRADFNGDVSKWNTISVTSMNSVFSGAAAFTGDVSRWNTAKVTNMRDMFNSATLFAGDLGSWDTGNVVDMGWMFHKADAFIGGNIGNWDTGKVDVMWKMFGDNKVFNADISQWNTASMGTVQEMFDGASAFNVDITGWNCDLVSTHAHRYRANMFRNADAWLSAYSRLDGKDSRDGPPTLWKANQ